MNISAPFILRPVATSLVMIAIMLIGIVGYTYLPLSALPEVDYPTIQVQTFLPGASADVMTTSVTAPLERQLGEMPGLKQMTSASSAGASVITLQFDLSLSLDIAEQEVQAAINASGSLLPQTLPAPPIYAKVNPADAPILTIAVMSQTMQLTQVEDLADTRIAQKISQLSGVGLVSINGGQRPAVRVQANLHALAAYGLNLDDLRTTIANANSNAPKGSFDGKSQAYTINANDQLQSADDYKNIVIAYKNGAPVRLTDVATVAQSAENVKLSSWANTSPAILLNVQRQPGANVIQVVDSIRAILPQIEAELPANVQVSVLTDRTNTIRASVSDVQFELMLAVCAGRAGDLPVPAQRARHLHPQPFGAAFHRGHVCRDVWARLLAQQSLTDGAHHFHRLRGGRCHRDDRKHHPLSRTGRNPAQCGAEGRGRNRFHHRFAHDLADRRADPASVHAGGGGPPVPRIRDHAGRHHPDFGGRLAHAGADALLCAKLLRHRSEEREQSRIARKSQEYFDRMIAEYDRLLIWVLDHQPLTMLVAVVTLVVTVLLYIAIPKGFFPLQDTGFIQGMTRGAPTISFSAMSDQQSKLARPS